MIFILFDNISPYCFLLLHEELQQKVTYHMCAEWQEESKLLKDKDLDTKEVNMQSLGSEQKSRF